MMRWLDPQKPVRKQMRASLHPSSSSSSSSNTMLNTSSSKHPPPTLYFRVKFYVNGEKIQNSNLQFSLVLGKRIDILISIFNIFSSLFQIPPACRTR